MRATRRSVLARLAGTATGLATWGTASAKNNTDPNGTVLAAVLLGENQVPPVETDAAGLAVFDLDADAGRLDFQVYVANVEDAVESHIHKGPPNFNGNAVVYLLQPQEEPISGTGLLASGTVTEADLFGVLGLEGFASLVESLHAENLYVNVHTEQHPEGEIRGQIQPVG